MSLHVFKAKVTVTQQYISRKIVPSDHIIVYNPTYGVAIKYKQLILVALSQLKSIVLISVKSIMEI